MTTKFLISLKNAFSEYAARRKAVADAKYAFKNFDLRTDVYTVARRFKGENGNTIGAELVRKYPNVNPMLPARSYVLDYKGMRVQLN